MRHSGLIRVYTKSLTVCVCDPVEAAAEADPANVPTVRDTQGGGLHGQVFRDP